jgi:hypothetical protein
MTIDGLTKEQVEMLDKLWSLDTMEEVRQFRSTLPRFRQQQIDTLMEIILQELAEDEITKMETFPDAEKILEEISKR